MKLWMKVTLITVVFAIPAFLTGRLIWPPAPGSGVPSLALLPFFLGLSVLEGLSFGLGIAFLIYGWPVMSTLANGSKRMTWAMFLMVTWLLVSLHAAAAIRSWSSPVATMSKIISWLIGSTGYQPGMLQMLHCF